MPVNTNRDFTDIDGLESDLTGGNYNNALVFVAWEHLQLDALVKKIVSDNGGNASVVPAWSDSDYDSIFVVTLTNDGSTTQVNFEHDYENLNSMSSVCPQ